MLSLARIQTADVSPMEPGKGREKFPIAFWQLGPLVT